MTSVSCIETFRKDGSGGGGMLFITQKRRHLLLIRVLLATHFKSCENKQSVEFLGTSPTRVSERKMSTAYTVPPRSPLSTFPWCA